MFAALKQCWSKPTLVSPVIIIGEVIKTKRMYVVDIFPSEWDEKGPRNPALAELLHVEVAEPEPAQPTAEQADKLGKLAVQHAS